MSKGKQRMACAWMFVLFAVLTGCSAFRGLDKVVPDKRVEYKSARSLPPLEVPPDLAAPGEGEVMAVPGGPTPGTATYSEYQGTRAPTEQVGSQTAVAHVGSVRLEREGDVAWLVIPESPEVIWPQVRNFWVKNGFTLKLEDPTVGIMETDWAENRADIPQGPIRNLLGKFLDQVYSAATRDKYRVRLERGKTPGTTDLYLSHRGLEEVVQDETTTRWQARPSDPELEAEMLKRLMVFLGVEEQRAGSLVASAKGTAERAHLTQTQGGEVYLTLDEDFSRAWRRTGIALDRVGFTLEDRDRSRGVYYVRYRKPGYEEEKKGMLSRLAFWRSGEVKPEDYLIRLIGEGDSTRIVILDKEGKAENSKAAERILKVLYDELK